MKIGFDISDLSTGRADGTTRYTFALAKRLSRLAPEHDWHYYAPTTPTASHALPDGGYSLHLSPWPKYWTQSRLPLELYRGQLDILFMPIQQIPYLRPAGLRTVAVVHDLAFHYYPEQFTYRDWLLLHAFSAYVAREADHIIAVSQATADDIAKQYGRSHHVHVVHHGVDHQHFTAPLGDSRGTLLAQHPALAKPYLLYVGQIQPRKNLTRLVAAFEQLADSDADVQLVIAGGHGWLQKPILQRLKTSKYAGRIQLLGRVSDELLPALYQNTEVFVLPSLYEGFGMPILEAMASGCPVVTSDVSSMPEVAGGAAVLVDPRDAESIAEGIKRARAQRQQLREAGLQHAQKFTWETTARQTLAVLTA